MFDTLNLLYIASCVIDVNESVIINKNRNMKPVVGGMDHTFLLNS